MSTDNAVTLPPGARRRARSRPARFWRARAPRERQLIAAVAIAVAVLLVWLIAVQPALRDLARDARRARPPRRAVAADAARRARERRRCARRRRCRRRRRPRRCAPPPSASAARARSRSRATAPCSPSPACRSKPCATGSARCAARRARGRSRRSCSRARAGYSGSISITLGGHLVIRKKRNRQLWSPTVASTGWSESTLAEQAWVEARGAAVRWAVAGAIVGVLVGPGRCSRRRRGWRARSPRRPTGRLVLADARGTVWSGSAVPVLTGGPDSRDASFLPGRLEWTLAPRWYGVELAARHDCCLNGTTHDPDPARPRPHPRHPRAAHRLGRPVAERLARRPRHALEHAPARRQLPPRSRRA